MLGCVSAVCCCEGKGDGISQKVPSTLKEWFPAGRPQNQLIRTPGASGVGVCILRFHILGPTPDSRAQDAWGQGVSSSLSSPGDAHAWRSRATPGVAHSPAASLGSMLLLQLLGPCPRLADVEIMAVGPSPGDCFTEAAFFPAAATA